MPGESGGTGAEGTAVAPAPLLLPASIPGYQHVHGQPAQANISTAGWRLSQLERTTQKRWLKLC